ncbi:periplasmic sensor signal transduction histidine kinase [Thermaerobacter marianensis DSM 12885]|uniref:Periplasmic sensor signal transduction histidine kinase n=1 Tax=Thermaerobacter marianensis (strain ATCC 700841 / DSM 12885 / JCM 10246 / 7p75a) TaxID=644966 RepID=E6SH64_THEM7|nr:hypothetical protein [Thermaerobacter marianensis]ADU51728.1 periplasmic sensor signal transduction histidine kinase [Thermaerobacter marianensis DSM 12885]
MPTLWPWVITWGLILASGLALWAFLRRAHYQQKRRDKI